ncbi:MAG: penicillin-binding protein 2 [Acidimicrobiia bacterium]|nr:penicillin-binding protein 2 [Acidimicrobiia bacterium]
MALKDFYEDKKFVQARIEVIRVAAILVFLFLLAGLWNLQILNRGYYNDLAEKNQVRSITLVAPRGKILDRNGQILVDNRPSFTLSVIREHLSSIGNAIELLASGLNLEVDSLKSQVEKHRRQPSYLPIVIKEDMTAADVAFIESHRLEFPGLDIIRQPRRFYREGPLAAHLLGYVGEISEKQVGTEEFRYCKPGDFIGKAGVERVYNRILTGVDGQKRVIVDSRGREVALLDTIEPVPGGDLRLTIDLDIQRAAENGFGEKGGAAVSLDPRSGELLSLVSRPAFDPNSFSSRISKREWVDLINDPRKPMQNRAIQSHFPPGSVFKIIMTIAGLQEGILKPGYRDFCSGSTVMYGRPFACHKKGGHGPVDLHKAIVNSCNVFFYRLGQKMGIDKIAYWAQNMGLGQKTGVDLPSEDSGLIPSPEWKKRLLKADWYAGETISVSIGQGYVSLTLIQTARAFGGFGIGGIFRTPHVVSVEELKRWGQVPDFFTERRFQLEEQTFQIVSRGLWGVVNEWGTGRRAAVPGFDVGGKTGTAQVVGREAQKAAAGEKKEEFEDNAWFVGYAPIHSAQIAAAVLVEHGGHGGESAAPVVHDMFQVFYDKNNKPGSAPMRISMK